MASSNTAWAWPWWTVMVIINVVNVIVAALIFRRSQDPRDGRDTVYRKRMRIMGLIFTLVGAYRSVFVCSYLTQRAWFDTVLNSSLLIRSFAIFAELSFSGLIAFALLQVNKDLPDPSAKDASKFKAFLMSKTPYVLISCIFLAQFFATYGVIAKSDTAFAIEETLWSLGFLSVLPLAITQVRRVYAVKDGEMASRLNLLRISTIIVAAWCVIYCCYGVLYHVPFECWGAAVKQIQTGIPEIKTGVGAIRDAFMIVNVTHEYSDWGFGFLFWHSAYFSICVWIAIFLMQAPRIKPETR